MCVLTSNPMDNPKSRKPNLSERLILIIPKKTIGKKAYAIDSPIATREYKSIK